MLYLIYLVKIHLDLYLLLRNTLQKLILLLENHTSMYLVHLFQQLLEKVRLGYSMFHLHIVSNRNQVLVLIQIVLDYNYLLKCKKESVLLPSRTHLENNSFLMGLQQHLMGSPNNIVELMDYWTVFT